MPRPTALEREAARDRTIPDIAGEGVRLVICGINPGLWSGAVGAHFARPGNRFWPALFEAGLTDRLVDTSAGMAPQDRAQLEGRGIALTNLVARATARADELSAAELRDGRARLEAFVARHHPAVVAVLGLGAYRTAFGEPRASVGEQPTTIGGARLWVLPNPSGLNGHETVASLAAAYGEAAVCAGIATRRR